MTGAVLKSKKKSRIKFLEESLNKITAEPTTPSEMLGKRDPESLEIPVIDLTSKSLKTYLANNSKSYQGEQKGYSDGYGFNQDDVDFYFKKHGKSAVEDFNKVFIDNPFNDSMQK